ncbi:MAG: hypothetical protein A2W91_11915 [Bacteroidetes bacterium GWF2_38_335]|nr:MAG: hypothetical protein A2W91_11915 [Bacteroidetes bacterium GWF2_38_335]OFY76880.1 MAG: hypothetical protein A2281_00030 [Bacteroidetes bacterium RIFOXYA12_FULL_38_20]HBS86727.1 proton-conducting membrane transporter [Bacteroidales bacterium]
MTDAAVFLILLVLSAGVFIVPARMKYVYTLSVFLASLVITSQWAITAFQYQNPIIISHSSFLKIHLPVMIIDRLSAFFILIINFTMLTGLVYAGGYLKPYQKSKTPVQFSLHFFAYLWLCFSMVMVTLMQSAFNFLVVWELMTVSSFILVMFDAESRPVLKAGINYLVQMHIGFILLLVGFLIAESVTGSLSFSGLEAYFSQKPNLPLFLVFFIGFGIKAGFIPLHTWLPLAHPAAPSHVSGVMSGVMIKMGIYGILRILGFVQDDLLTIGVIILIVSVLSGLYGVMMAIVQHDLKRLLAYHSIENIGIIGIGIGLGVIGLATVNPVLTVLGFTGGILHVLNHSLFKSLLFYNAGSVYSATHTRNLEKLGGLIKTMPYSAFLFLIGALAICGLPPFNGFVSEYLIYLGMFKEISDVGLYEAILLLLSIVGLTIIGGLAIFCFTKAFGIVYLGQSRSEKTEHAVESPKIMIIPQMAIVAVILLIGLGSFMFIGPVAEISLNLFKLDPGSFNVQTFAGDISRLSIIGGIFIVLTIGIFLIRRYVLSKRTIEKGPTWGCGYTAGNERQQYTATSFADNYSELAKPVIGGRKEMEDIGENDYFPKTRKFETSNNDGIQTKYIDRPISKMVGWLKKLAIMQTGQIQHYILYAFVFMLVIFILTWFNII